MSDDFFRIRLVCVLLDTCGMCFDRGSQKRKLDNFLVFFQVCLFSISCGARQRLNRLVLPSVQRTDANGGRIHGHRLVRGY